MPAVRYLLNGAGGAVQLQLRAVGRGSGGVAHGAGGSASRACGGAGGVLAALSRLPRLAHHSTPG
jgi:hypothetical protein